MSRSRFVLAGGSGFLGQAIASDLAARGDEWLHMHDLNRMIEWSVEHEQIEGLFNGTGPNPVTNAEFIRSLRHALHRPWSPPVPSSLVHVGARLMGTEASLALTGRRCVPRRFLNEGFEFQYLHLRAALHELLH